MEKLSCEFDQPHTDGLNRRVAWKAGDRKKEKRTCSQAFQQTAYVPLRWLFHLGLVSANKSEQQSWETLTRSCQVSPGEMF